VAVGSPVQPLPTQPPVAPTPPPQPTVAAPASYTVVSGDTLTGIAVKQNIPADQRTAWIQQVRTLNSLTGDLINVGQVLKLPPATAAAPAAATTPAAPAAAGTAAVGTPRPTVAAGTTPAAGTAPVATGTRAP
jgi:LysM repeat protein